MKKTLKLQKKKISILSFALALIFLFSWNYTPISLISKKLSNLSKRTSAYSSTTTNKYYGVDGVTTVTTESNISAGKYADGTKDYFNNSTNNLNILTNYNARYDEWFAKFAEDYLLEQDKKADGYNGKYSQYLAFIKYDSLSKYYDDKKSSLSANSFRTYFETFVTSVHEWEENSTKHELPILIEKNNSTGWFETYVYNSFANYLLNEQKAVEVDKYNQLDGLNSDVNFYENSISYLRVKKFIDEKILKTTVVYSYDGKTQTAYTAAIIADKAPVTQGYYYKTDDLESTVKPEVLYVTQRDTSTYTNERPKVYFAGARSSLTSGSASQAYNNILAQNFEVTTYDDNEQNWDADWFNNNPVYFRLIQPGEFGYLDSTHLTYYKYSKVTYNTGSGSNFQIYIHDDYVTDNERAAYKSLYDINIITQDDLNADRANIVENNGEIDTSGCFYVQIPYFNTPNKDGKIGGNYFIKLFDFISGSNYENMLSLFTENGESKVYFKFNQESSSNNLNVYIGENEYSSFISAYPSYIKNKNLIKIHSDEFYSNTDFIPVTNSYAQYYEEGFNLYFRQNRTYFTQTDYTYGSDYELEVKPNKNLEKVEVSSEKYDNFDIYALVDKYEIAETTYSVVSSDLVNNSIYSLIDAANAPSTDYQFYYKHTLTTEGEIDTENYETVDGNKVIYVLLETVEISQNTYKVITSASLEVIRNLYVSVPESVTKSIYGDATTYPLYYKHSTETINQIYVIDDSEKAKENEVYKNLNYKVITTKDYENNYFRFVELKSTDVNYNKFFKLYYKLDANLENEESYNANSSLFIQNAITGKNAIYIVDDSLTASDKKIYSGLYYIALSNAEFNSESDLYVLINTNDENYNSSYTKLYYKYLQKPTTDRKIYIFSSQASDVYTSFHNTDDGYNAEDYELIQSDDPNYVPGLQLYYKKIGTSTTTNITQNTYYYYNTSSQVTLQANSFYAISFYAYTNGNYYDKDFNLVEGEVEASVYIEDTKNYISNISIEKINTHGKWQKYVVFIATDILNSSTISLSLYMGNKTNVAGSLNATTISGTVLFNEIQITLIGETDYNKQAIDDEKVQSEVKDYEIITETLPIINGVDLSNNNLNTLYEKIENVELAEDRILDSNYEYYYKHKVDGETILEDYELDSQGRKQVYVYIDTVDEKTKDIEVKTNPTITYNVDKYKNPVIIVDETMIGEHEVTDNRTINESVISNWNYNFNFDSSDLLGEKLNNLSFAGTEDGFTLNDDWHYYISRDNSGQGNYELLQAYQSAYTNGHVSVSVIEESTIDKTIKEDDDDDKDAEEDKKEEDKKEEDKKEEDKLDLETNPNTFNNSNKVLKIANTDRTKSLGVTSVPFTINQLEYYKVTVWIYSPDKDAKATLKLESVLKTTNSPSNGSLLSTTASAISASFENYDNKKTNEYCWIPVSFYIEGNAYQNQDVRLVLLADKNSTVYFDNITVSKISSSTYDTVSSDSDNLTNYLALSPSSALISSGITNGYFNQSTVTSNYANKDYTLPGAAKNWTSVSTNSTSVIAGVVPTSEEYTSKSENFYTKYNGGNLISTNGFANNVFAMHAPTIITSPIDSTNESKYQATHNYTIYTSSMSLSATSIYEISFEFLAGYEFKGNLVATLYASSVATKNIVSSIKISSEDLASDWNKYTFYAKTDLSSVTVYLEIGIENATGTCFFQKASSIKSSKTTLESIRDSIVGTENNDTQNSPIYNYESLKNIRFVNLADYNFSINNGVENNYGLLDSNNFLVTTTPESTYTVGNTSTAVASFYTSTQSNYYKAEIKNLKFIKDTGNENYEILADADNIFYIKEITSTNDNNETVTTYKLYSDSMFTIEVVGFDVSGNGKVESSEVSNYEITKAGTVVTINVNNTDTTATTVTETNYKYNFTNDVIINNVIIPAAELNNNYSQNVLILANSYSTDYTSVTSTYTHSLSSSAYYAIKFYVKTSDMGENGVNIFIDSVTVNWNKINTTKSSNADENGFVCYELWISTNTSSFSKLLLTLSLGSSKETSEGYAIIAGMDIKKFDSETLFNEYCDAKDELYVENDEGSVAKRFFGKKSETKTDEKDEKDEEKSSTIWATFFYIFSSLLLGAVLIMALVAIIIKKHPIKRSKKVKDDSFVVIDNNKDKSKKSKKEKDNENKDNDALDISLNEQNEESSTNADNDSESTEENNNEENKNEEQGF